MSTNEEQTKSNPSDDPEALAEARRELKRAYLLVSFGNFDAALDACRSADDVVDGAHHLPKTLEGSFLTAKGEVREAIRILRGVTKAFPGESLPRIHFAEACYLAGRKRQGDRALSKARQLDDGEHAEFLDSLEASWEDVEPSEIPPPLEVAE